MTDDRVSPRDSRSCKPGACGTCEYPVWERGRDWGGCGPVGMCGICALLCWSRDRQGAAGPLVGRSSPAWRAPSHHDFGARSVSEGLGTDPRLRFRAPKEQPLVGSCGRGLAGPTRQDSHSLPVAAPQNLGGRSWRTGCSSGRAGVGRTGGRPGRFRGYANWRAAGRPAGVILRMGRCAGPPKPAAGKVFRSAKPGGLILMALALVFNVGYSAHPATRPRLAAPGPARLSP